MIGIKGEKGVGSFRPYALDRAHVLHLLSTELKSYKKLVNPDKILLGNPNVMYALGGRTETGTIREAFFANHSNR